MRVTICLDWIKPIGMLFFLVSAVTVHPLWTQETSAATETLTWRIHLFADIGGHLHGIAFDDQGRMVVAKNGKEILRVSTTGRATSFVTIDDATGFYSDGPGDTFIYDMEYGPDGHLYVAAEDRVLRITPTGKVAVVLKQNFSGRWGACGIALDTAGNVFVAYDRTVMRVQPNGQQSIFLSKETSGIHLEAVVGLEMDAAANHLYVCDGNRGSNGKLLRVPLKTDGTHGDVEIVFQQARVRPEYLSIGPNGTLVAKGPENDRFVIINSGKPPVLVYQGDIGRAEIETIAFGKGAFGAQTVYGTEWFKGRIYKIDF